MSANEFQTNTTDYKNLPDENRIPPSRSKFYGWAPQGYRRNDVRIKEDICDAIMRNGTFDPSGISIEVRSGEVCLKGLVSERRFKHLVEDICADVLGVGEISNHIRIKGLNTPHYAEESDEKLFSKSSGESQNPNQEFLEILEEMTPSVGSIRAESGVYTHPNFEKRAAR